MSQGKVTGQKVQQVAALTPSQKALLNLLISRIAPSIGTTGTGGSAGGAGGGGFRGILERARQGQNLDAFSSTSGMGDAWPGTAPPTELGPVGPSPLQQQAFGLGGQLPDIMSQMKPVSRFATEMFGQQLVPQVMAGLGGVGAARSSGAANILGREARNLSLGLGAQFAPMQFQVPGQMAALGGQQRGISQEQQGFDLARWQAQQPWQDPALNFLGTALGTPAFTNVGFQGAYRPGTMETLAGPLGMMGAAGIMSGLI